MDDRSIRVTLGVIFVALVLVGGLSVGTSLWATRAQQHDALVINLASRQRMLSQKVVREAALGGYGQEMYHLANIETFSSQFDAGLGALMDGGRLTYAGTTVSVPPATDPAFRAALEEVQATWEALHRAAQTVLENEPGSPAFIQDVEDLERLSDATLEKMDAAVRVYQAGAEARVARLRRIQLGFLLAGGLVLALGFGLILTRVLRPVSALETAVRRMEQGDLDAPVRVGVRNELGHLAGAFEDMRAQIKAHIEEMTKLQTAVEQSADIVFITDRNGIIEYVNPAFEKITGYSEEEALGKTPRILKSGAMGAEYYQKLWDTILSGRVFRDRLKDRRKDGAFFYYDQTITPLKDPRGNITHFISTGKDVTEEVRAQEAVRRQRDLLTVRGRILGVTLRALDLDARLDLILEEVLRYLGVEFGGIHLVQGNEVLLRCWRGLSDAFRSHVRSFPADDPPDWMLTPRVVHERLSEAGLTPDFAKREGVQAWASFPLHLPARQADQAGEWLGTILVAGRRYEALHEDQIQALEGIVDQLALAVDHARAYRQSQERLARLETLREVDRAIVQRLDLQAVLHVVLERVPQELGADAVAVSLLEEESLRTEVFVMRLPNGAVLEEGGFTLADSLLHWLVERQEPVIIYDLEQDPRVQMHRERLRSARLASYLAVPLIVREETIGVLHILTTEPKVFADEDVAFFHTLAGQAAIAIENARAFEAATRRAEELTIAGEILRSFNATPDVAETFPTIAQGLRAITGCKRVSLALLDESQAWFTLVALDQPRLELDQGTRVSVADTSAAADVLAGRAHLTPDLAAEADAPAGRVLHEAGYRSRINLPLQVGDQVIGALSLAWRRRAGYDAAHLPLLGQIAESLALALERSRLFEETRQQLHELEGFFYLSTALREAEDPEAMYPIIVDTTLEVLGAEGGALFLQESEDTLRMVAARGALEVRLDEKVPRSEDLPWHCVLTGQPYVIHDVQAEPLLPEAYKEAVGDLEAGVCAPLRAAQETLGVMSVLFVEREVLSEATVRLFTALADLAGNALRRAMLHHELEESYIQTVLALANAMDARDTYTAGHSQRLAQWAEATARELGCSKDEITAIHWGALLHDIGKIGVPDRILLKPGELNDAEWDVIKRHPEMGAEIVAPVKKLEDVAPIIRAHQEHWDGSGYPERLQGEEIPLGARILAVVDAYGAMIDERPYKPARSHAEAVAELQACAGTQFDPQVVEAFLQVLERGVDITGGGGVKPFWHAGGG